MKFIAAAILGAMIATAHPHNNGKSLVQNQHGFEKRLDSNTALPADTKVSSSSDKIPGDLTPTVINGGHLSDSGLAALLSKTKKHKRRDSHNSHIPTRHAPSSMGKRADDDNPALTWSIPGNTPSSKVVGPFTSIAINVDENIHILKGFSVVDMNGVRTDIGNIENLNKGNFTFSDGDVLWDLTLHGSTANGPWVPSGIAFATTKGNKYDWPNYATQDHVYHNADIGSGYIAEIKYDLSSAGDIESYAFGCIKPIKSTGVTNYEYVGLPSGGFKMDSPTNVLSVGTLTIDARNSSVQQTETLTTTKTATSLVSYSYASAYTVGGSYATEMGASVLGFNLKTTVTASFETTQTTTRGTQDSETTTNAATFPIACPGRSVCTGVAFFNVYSIDVDFIATVTAQTDSGPYSWPQWGRYTNSDSSSLQLNVTQYD